MNTKSVDKTPLNIKILKNFQMKEWDQWNLQQNARILIQ